MNIMDLFEIILPMSSAIISLIFSISTLVISKKQYKKFKDIKNVEKKLMIKIDDSEIEIKEEDKKEILKLLSELQCESNSILKSKEGKDDGK